MNDPRTCVYGHARKFGAMGQRGTCTRPREQPCLCGLQKAEHVVIEKPPAQPNHDLGPCFIDTVPVQDDWIDKRFQEVR